MMTSDEMLMAYADGALDAADAAQVKAALVADPTLAARVEMFRETRRLLAASAAPLAPVDAADPLAAKIRAAVSATAAAPTSPTPAPANMNWRPMAAAASVAVLLAVGWWVGLGPRTGGDPALGPELAHALTHVPSGEVTPLRDSVEFIAIASFDTEKGLFCREYETHSADRGKLAVACLDAGGWHNRYVAEMMPQDGGYIPASGSDLEQIETVLRDLGAGEPLDSENEIRALSDAQAAPG